MPATAGNEPAGQALLEIAALHRHPRAPSRDEAPALKAALAAVAGGAGGDRARPPSPTGRKPGDPDERGPAASAAGAAALPRRALAARRAARSTTGASSTSTAWRDCASRTSTRSAPCIALVARLIADDKLQGLRLDHIDGLRNPIQYCRRLQRLIRAAQGGSRRPFYLVVEKILGRRRAHAGASRRRRHHRLRMAQRDLARSGRRSRPRAARSLPPRGDRQSASVPADPRARQGPRAGQPAVERVHRAGAAARAHRRRPLPHPRLHRRASAKLRSGCSSSSSRSIAPTSPLPGRRRRTAPPSSRRSRAARARWFGAGRRDLRFPARRADARPGRRRAAPATAARACGGSPSSCSNSPDR